MKEINHMLYGDVRQALGWVNSFVKQINHYFDMYQWNFNYVCAILCSSLDKYTWNKYMVRWRIFNQNISLSF